MVVGYSSLNISARLRVAWAVVTGGVVKRALPNTAADRIGVESRQYTCFVSFAI